MTRVRVHVRVHLFERICRQGGIVPTFILNGGLSCLSVGKWARVVISSVARVPCRTPRTGTRATTAETL